MSQSPPDRQERIRVAQACDNCRDKKSKCDGVKPVCGRCQQKSLNCRYGVSKRVKNQQIMRDLANKVAQYESMLQKNIPIQQTVYDGGSGLENQFTSPALHFSSLSSSSMSRHPSTLPAAASSDSQSATTSSPPTISRRPSEMNPHGNPIGGIHPNASTQSLPNLIQPPPRVLLEQASQAFFQGTTILFSFFDEEEIETLFSLVYANTVSSEAHIALAQLCAVAAVGCQYFPHMFDTATRMGFLSVVKLHLEECVEEAPLPAVRVLALLAMYFTFEKRTAALLYADMGLRLAALHSKDPLFQEDASNPWQRSFRSLAFLDGWLCSTTGHLSSPQTREIQSSIVIMGTVDSSMISVIQYEMVKIAVLSNLVLQDIHHARYVSSSTVSHYKTRLQNWLLALPAYMRLEYLLDVDQDTEFLRPILLIHLLYMSTIVLVYRRTLVDLASVDHELSTSDIFHQAQSFLEPCLWTGRQVAKILNLCLSRGQIIQMCWMFTNTTSSTCNVLLYFVASHLLHGNDLIDIGQDLAAAKQCLDVLAFCSQADQPACHHLVGFSSIYNDLAQIHIQRTSQSRASAHLDDQTGNDKLRKLLLQIANHLIHPFEGGFRRYVDHMHNEEARPSTRTGISSTLIADSTESNVFTSTTHGHQGAGSLLFLNDLGQTLTGEDRDVRKGKEPDQESGASRVRSIVFGS